MAALRSRNGALLFGIEAVEGVAETLSAGTHGVLVENPRINYQPQNTQTNELTASLDNRGPIVGGVQVSVTFDVYLKGSGVAGTAPQLGNLLKACGWSEVVTGTAVPASPAVLAGGSATTATLGASASATAQAYRGMPLNLTLDNTDYDEHFVGIADYTAGKVATLSDTFSPSLDTSDEYQIPINVLYKPLSTGIPSGTINLYQDGLLHVVSGCRGTFQLASPAAGPGKFSFTMTGMYNARSDSSVPTVTYESTRPPIFRGGRMLIDRSLAATQTFTLDNGNRLVYPPNPNADEGFDPSVITERNMTGQVDPLATLIATRDILTALRNGTEHIVHARWGTAVGNRVMITIPAAVHVANTPGDRDGLMTEETQFSCTGQDAGAFLAFY